MHFVPLEAITLILKAPFLHFKPNSSSSSSVAAAKLEAAAAAKASAAASGELNAAALQIWVCHFSMPTYQFCVLNLQ